MGVQPEITAARSLKVECLTGSTEWTINEFDRLQRVMLVATTAGTQFHAHFTAEQWAEFQTLVAGGE